MEWSQAAPLRSTPTAQQHPTPHLRIHPHPNWPQPAYLNLLGPSQFFDEDTLLGYRTLTLQWIEACSAVAVELLEVVTATLANPNLP